MGKTPTIILNAYSKMTIEKYRRKGEYFINMITLKKILSVAAV